MAGTHFSCFSCSCLLIQYTSTFTIHLIVFLLFYHLISLLFLTGTPLNHLSFFIKQNFSNLKPFREQESATSWHLFDCYLLLIDVGFMRTSLSFFILLSSFLILSSEIKLKLLDLTSTEHTSYPSRGRK